MANLLIRPSPEASRHSAPQSRSPWRGTRIFWASAAVLMAIAILEFGALKLGVPHWLEQGRLDRAESLLDSLSWIARDSAVARTQLGQTHRAHGQSAEALRAFRRSHSLTPDAGTLAEVARLLDEQLERASGRGAAGVEVDPRRGRRAGRLWVRRLPAVLLRGGGWAGRKAPRALPDLTAPSTDKMDPCYPQPGVPTRPLDVTRPCPTRA